MLYRCIACLLALEDALVALSVVYVLAQMVLPVRWLSRYLSTVKQSAL